MAVDVAAADVVDSVEEIFADGTYLVAEKPVDTPGAAVESGVAVAGIDLRIVDADSSSGGPSPTLQPVDAANG